MIKMKTNLILISISGLLLSSSIINATISLVYNLRIAESTKQQIFEKSPHPCTLSSTIISNNRIKRDHTKHNLLGLLESFSYANPNFYIRADFAFGQIREATLIATQNLCSTHSGACIRKHSVFKELETDDILLKSGYSYSVNSKTKLTISGLLGIPTHKDFVLEHYQLGYGHVGLGIQLDGSFIYSILHKSALRCAFRLIQFIPGHIWHTVDNICKNYKINIGNLIDVFIAHHTVFGHHSFEFGYDQIFFCNGKVSPYLDGAREKINYIRPEFFSTYKYTIVTNHIHHILSATISSGFDIWPKLHGNKRIIEAWFSYRINF